jgi:hypothetical protein
MGSDSSRTRLLRWGKAPSGTAVVQHPPNREVYYFLLKEVRVISGLV